MKHIIAVFKIALVLQLHCLSANHVSAQGTLATEYFDSIEISLLTCQPHDEVYSLYGHTAIRYHDMHKGGFDLTFNYGVFDWNKPFFAARFVLGLTDYELGALPYQPFLQEYRHFGSMVTEQVLNLTIQEKAKLQQALSVNLQPENRIYRYNYFYNNCTTKARDIIEHCINGKIEYAERKNYEPTYRQIVHEMTRSHPWSRFGNDMLLGIMADQSTNQRQQEFLPGNLMYDFDHAVIVDHGNCRPLVKERRIAVPAGVQVIQDSFPLTPWQCSIILAALASAIYAVQWKRKRVCRLWDILLMATITAIGIILFLMLFSQHPTVNLNLQFILLNPLPLFYLRSVIRQQPTRYWNITAILAVLFLIGAIFQQYAEGIIILALCLLLQCHIHYLARTKWIQQMKKQK